MVTTSIETDVGLDRKLPPIPDSKVLPPVIAERNILPISLKSVGELLVKNKLVDIKDLRKLTIAFLDNGGALKNDARYCDYCGGKRDAKSSDSPTEAVVSLMSHREAAYAVYISLRSE